MMGGTGGQTADRLLPLHSLQSLLTSPSPKGACRLLPAHRLAGKAHRGPLAQFSSRQGGERERYSSNASGLTLHRCRQVTDLFETAGHGRPGPGDRAGSGVGGGCRHSHGLFHHGIRPAFGPTRRRTAVERGDSPRADPRLGGRCPSPELCREGSFAAVGTRSCRCARRLSARFSWACSCTR